MNWVKKNLTKAGDLWDRSLDRHIRVAVTGLSGAGKTAFITSLINQLLHAPNEHHLTFFQAVEEQRLKATKLVMHEELHVPSFNYHQNLELLTHSEPQWPQSTKNISQAQMKCRFEVKSSWRKWLQKEAYITVEIIDYPGEWLLDLPLLSLSYKDWSRLCIEYLGSERRKSYTQNIREVIQNLQFEKEHDEAEAQSLLETLPLEYRKALMEYRRQYSDYSLALPGRFILPGELEGAPTLDFFPVLNEDLLSLDWEAFNKRSLLKVLERRYNYYRNNVVKPFFEDYFSKVDRQIVLIDTTAVLESDYESCQDLKKTIEKLLTGFSYGRSSWLKRLFSPSIDKLMIATTKADLVPPDQHASLEAFMQKMVAQVKNEVGYEGVEVETMAIGAISTSEPVSTEHQGKTLLCVKGIDPETRESVIHYPGKVPSSTLSREQWQNLEIDFSSFAVPEINPDEPLPHIRMDKALQFLIGDKFL